MRNLRRRLAKKVISERGGKSQRQYAAELGLSYATYNRMEAASQNVSLDILELLCERLDCDVGDLFPTE